MLNYRNKDWRNSMRLTLDYNYMMKKFIGADGFTDAELNEMKDAPPTRSTTLPKTAARA